MNEFATPEMIRVSYGTAIVLGLIKAKQDIAPTTAYLLWDRGCTGSCSFCPRANGNANEQKLSRIIWPEFDFNEVLKRLSSQPRPFARVCLQTGFNPDLNNRLIEFTKRLTDANLITSVTLSPSQTLLAEELLEQGVDHIGIGLDGATKTSYEKHKKKDWDQDWPSLLELLQRHKQKIEVHLIFGLGDNEEDFCRTIEQIICRGGKISLFALTPVNGGQAPELSAYRRVQIFRYLCESKGLRISDFAFENGQLVKILSQEPDFSNLLDNGDCFRTSGCGNCNRPYYNERPGQRFYNFPRPLKHAEFIEAYAESGLKPDH